MDKGTLVKPKTIKDDFWEQYYAHREKPVPTGFGTLMNQIGIPQEKLAGYLAKPWFSVGERTPQEEEQMQNLGRLVSSQLPYETTPEMSVLGSLQGIKEPGKLVSMTRKTGAGEIPTKKTPMPEGGNIFQEASNLADLVASTPLKKFEQLNKKLVAKLTESIKSTEGKIVAYHGTPRQFSGFDPSQAKIGRASDTTAFHFTDNPMVANEYARGPKAEIHVVEIDLKNPKVFQNGDEMFAYADRKISEGDYPPIGWEIVAQDAAKAEGYDGIICLRENLMPDKPIGGPSHKADKIFSGAEYVVFDANQIKTIKRINKNTAEISTIQEEGRVGIDRVSLRNAFEGELRETAKFESEFYKKRGLTVWDELSPEDAVLFEKGYREIKDKWTSVKKPYDPNPSPPPGGGGGVSTPTLVRPPIISTGRLK